MTKWARRLVLGGCLLPLAVGAGCGRRAVTEVKETVKEAAASKLPAGSDFGVLEMPKTEAETKEAERPAARETETGALSGQEELRAPETQPEMVRPAGAFVDEASEVLTEEQEELIYAYMDRYYAAVSALEMRDISDLFADSASGQLAFHEKAWEYQIGLRAVQETDLHLEDCYYVLWILEWSEAEDGSFDVKLGERSYLHFAQCPETESRVPSVRHDFVLTQENGEWRIREHMQWDGAFWSMLKGYDGTDLEQIEDPERVFEERKETLLKQIEEGMPGRETGTPAAEDPAADHPYDREAAVAYARQFVGQRSEDWADYGEQGGNCQNFVSQCLSAGGIPMDTQGEKTWKWFGAAVDETSEDRGCSLSWINVDYFYAYARDNQGYGLCAGTGADFWSGRPGDLIVMGTPSDWNHIVIITEVIKDENGQVVDYLICSNTLDVKDFPVSAYPQRGRELIRIFGWND